ncbi:hypothetical protein MFIFM68171_02275 [Madurella fahalii]|uniref:F-box domain-containing protein n=1 Tax=Madurella fahalii TaxID=1157608 RepID=A0ABQ0G2S6_9PEZI
MEQQGQQDCASAREDAILFVTSYYRRDWDLVRIHSSPREHAPVRDSIQTPFSRSFSISLGALSRLPPELLLAVLRELDVLSTFRFRQVNSLARSVVSDWQPYRALATHALEAFRAILRTGLAPRFAINDIYRLLHTSNECVACSHFSPLLFLPTLQRCCFRYLRDAPRFRVMSLHALAKASKSPASELRKSLAVVHTVPGYYSAHDRLRNKRIRLVSVANMRSNLANVNFSLPRDKRPSDIEEVIRCMVATAFPRLDRELDGVEARVSCIGCQVAVENDPGDGRLRDQLYLRDRCYTVEGFLEHFESCPEAQALWSASCDGTATVEVPALKESGGFLNVKE